jgi:nucleotide-binding universal stress UspA family protein
MLERILIPLDGSETAEAILPHVRRVLRRHDAETILLHAVPPFPPDFHLAVPRIDEDAHRYIRRMNFLLVNDGVRSRGLVRHGAPAETILSVSEEEGVSLIAMSTHGRTGLERLVFGSAAEQVLRESRWPVLIVRSLPSSVGTISRGRLEGLPFHRILVPLDGAEESLSILPALKEFASSIDARVRLLAVVDDLAERWHSPGFTLESAQKALAAACIPADIETCRGDAATEILRVARELEADLIAMSTHGRSGPSRWVLGSVTERVLRASSVPMLLVRRLKAIEPSLSPGRAERASRG